MGIFDNVNWQQAIPMAMTGMAAAMDPRSGPMLAQGGWNAVQNYMRQQAMQQEQEQFQERLKLYKEEQSQRERTLKMHQQRFDREQEEKLDEDFIFQNLGTLSDIPDDAGISEYYNRMNARAKEVGRKPLSSSVFGKVMKNWEIMPTPTGEVGFGYKSDGSLWVMEKIKQRGGAKWAPAKIADRVTPEMIKVLKENPEMALQFADSLEKDHPEAAKGVRTQANRLLQEKQQTLDEKSLGEQIRLMDLMYKRQEDEIKSQFGWNEMMKTFDSGYAEGTPEHAQWKANLTAATKALHDSRAKMELELWNKAAGTKEAQKRFKDQLGKAYEEFKGANEEENNQYRAIGQEINRTYGDKLSREQKIALTRSIFYTGKELRAGHEARGGKEPVSQKPEEGVSPSAMLKKPVSQKPTEDRMGEFRAAFDALTPEQKARAVDMERKGHKLFVKDGKIHVKYLGRDLPI